MRSVNFRRILQTCGLTLVAATALLTAVPHARAQEGEEAAATTEKVAVLKTNMGDIVLRFFPDVAPNHVENFLTLAADGFYDGVKFHRVIPGFVIQGGDPNSKDDHRGNDGRGGSATNVKAEFTKLPQRALDNKYSAFGMVVEGMDVADAIVNLPRDNNDNPLPANPAIIESVVIEEREVPARPEWSILD